MKMKEFGPQGGARVPGAPPLDPPMAVSSRRDFAGQKRINELFKLRTRLYVWLNILITLQLFSKRLFTVNLKVHVPVKGLTLCQ